MSDAESVQTVYLAQDPNLTEPLFATTDFDAISEFVDAAPENYYDELGVVNGADAREIIEETY